MGRRIVHADGMILTPMVEAVLSVLPLDGFVDAPCARMEVVGGPNAVPEICREFRAIIDRVEGRPVELAKLERSPSTHAPAKPSPWCRPARPACTATCS